MIYDIIVNRNSFSIFMRRTKMGFPYIGEPISLSKYWNRLVGKTAFIIEFLISTGTGCFFVIVFQYTLQHIPKCKEELQVN